MIRFFIDTDDGDLLVQDEEGLDYADAASARTMALASLSNMAKDGIQGDGRRTFSARIRDEAGATVYCASLRLEDEWLVLPTSP